MSSYSTTEDFPAPTLIDEVRGEAWWDAWYEASYEERWDRCVEILRAESVSSPSLSREMRPDHWRSYRFSPGEINGFNLRAYVTPSR